MLALLVIAALVCAFALGWIARSERERHLRVTRRPSNVVDLTLRKPLAPPANPFRDRRRPW